MRPIGLRRHRAAVQARPDWLPHPMVMHAILALWVAVALLRLFEGP